MPTRRSRVRKLAGPYPVCAACSKPIRSGTAVAFQHGEVFHVKCVTSALRHEAPDQGKRLREAKTRAAENLERAARLIQDAERLRRGTNALDPALLHTVIIIRRDRPDLRTALRERFGEEAIILEDRRQRDRRQKPRQAKVERRSGKDRRSPVTPREEKLWAQAGYRIVSVARPQV